MNIPEEFGNYLLLKKLTEDPLGETFRAGKVGKDGMEQVVLLRVFNGKGLDGEQLWQKVSGRAAVQQALRSPNIGSGADLGRVRSFPYAAYDYISGKNLATVLAQSERLGSPVPTDHALLIAERLALALAAAYETRVQDERVLHGFVAPHLVMISNEGETRLLGFEVAPGLRALASVGWNDETIRPYIAPEALAGGAVTKADDVWSLGAILFELLTGERLPAATSGGNHAALIDAATLANEGTPLPAAVAALLKKSLVPADQRVGDAGSWHKALSKMMIDGHYSPTTFNLAFFMHNLFRDEIERESREIEAERRIEVPQRTAARAAAPAAMAATMAAGAAADARESSGVRQGTLPGVPAAAAARPAGSKAPLFIGLAAVVLIAAAIGGYMAFFRGPAKAATAAQAANTGPASTPVAATGQPGAPGTGGVPLAGGAPGTEAATPAGPSPEEIQAQIQQMFEARSKEMEAKLKTQYDDRIKQLQQQLEDSRKAATAPQPARQDKPAAPPPVQTEPSPTPADTRPATRTDAPANLPAVQIPNATQPTTTAGATQQDVPRPTPSPAAPATANPAPAQTRQVQTGDLVPSGSPGSAMPKLRSNPEPLYPAAAKKMRRAAQVDVRVLVDENGRVLDAQHVGTKAGMGFDEAAVDAARAAKFQPATKDGVRVKMWTVVRISFKP